MTRISTPCALGRRWGAWRELWERCWKPIRLCSIVFEAAQQAHHAAPVSQESRSYPTIGCVNAQFVLDQWIWRARSTPSRRIIRNHPKRNSSGDLRLAGPQWSHRTCPRASRCHHGDFRKNKKMPFATSARPHSAVRRTPWPQVSSRGILGVPPFDFANSGYSLTPVHKLGSGPLRCPDVKTRSRDLHPRSGGAPAGSTSHHRLLPRTRCGHARDPAYHPVQAA